ncbi:hypothetical protein D5366_02035 [Neokomagataea tanensis]|uniref:Uncharacterized protein n=1 Tax=Neokomagataea tanensis TaxID=661191 RepID=A0A4Y6VBC4_9PROT|nr:hypothetical protein D5366_02035 [Neokomagataea tanensis]
MACASFTLALLGGCSAPSQPVLKATDLQKRLSSRASATATLQSLCRTPIHVQNITVGHPPTPSAIILNTLSVQSPEAVRVRHVALLCGQTPFSDAWNWYIPERLTPQMNDTLEHTQTPFGRAVRETHFTRHTISSTILTQNTNYILENRALLRREADDAPIALVIEDYKEATLHAGQ